MKSKHKGTIKGINALELGKLSVSLGAGRINKEDKIDYGVGIKLSKHIGDKVKKGEVLGVIYVNDRIKMPNSDDIFDIE